MGIDVVNLRELNASDFAKWNHLQATEAHLSSPFFRSEYHQCVSDVRGDTFVCIWNERDSFGVFPFQRNAGNIAGPVGGSFCDFENVITTSSSQNCILEIVRRANLNAYDFLNLPASCSELSPYTDEVKHAPFMDLRGGFENYCEQLPERQRFHLKRLKRKIRAAEAQFGPIRFEEDSKDPDLFRQLLEWKSAQYVRTNSVDAFSVKWTVELLERIWQYQSDDFGGSLSAIYFGNELAAVHFGMRSRTTFHCWFPAYNQEFAQFSPGLILFLKIAEAAAKRGIECLDFGPGEGRFKDEFATGSKLVAGGSINCGIFTQLWRNTSHAIRKKILGTPLRNTAISLARKLGIDRRSRNLTIASALRTN